MSKRRTITYVNNESAGILQSRAGPNINTGATIALSRELAAAKKEAAKSDGRAARMDKDKLMKLLFSMFNEYDYWSLKAIREKTNQPEAYLKECLENIAVMERGGTFSLTYRLKDEYRKSRDVERKENGIEMDGDDDNKQLEEEDDVESDVEMEDVAQVHTAFILESLILTIGFFVLHSIVLPSKFHTTSKTDTEKNKQQHQQHPKRTRMSSASLPLPSSSPKAYKNDNSHTKSPTSHSGSGGATTVSAGGVKINENNDLRASFTGKSSLTDNSTHISNSCKDIIQSSPLLSSTPPTVSKALIRSYPYLILTDRILGVLTWSEDDSTLCVLVVLIASLVILYFETIITYFGHILAVGVLSLYANLSLHLDEEQKLYPTLDDVVHRLSSVSQKSELFLSPVTSLNLTAYDLKRLLFTTIFLSPAYILVSFFILPPKSLILIATIFVLTYHSNWSRVTRRILWKSKTFRIWQ
ncbi:unnamed protein product [Ambrosiozyma monospora]|uniref:Unnamed protein product n=1 Tax=Ambrosiozyma monospora TaxID=43982 RepID=A0ACB5T261_AMBMO|nr:unnamed protein product [Ambrosiozyma monospora]